MEMRGPASVTPYVMYASTWGIFSWILRRSGSRHESPPMPELFEHAQHACFLGRAGVEEISIKAGVA